MKIIQVYDKLDRHGGAQSVIFTLHNHFVGKGWETFVSGMNSYDKFFLKSEISNENYLVFKLSNIFLFSNAIIISHSRKITTMLVTLNKILRLNSQIVHVAHSIFTSKRLFSIYPQNIIAVSEAVKDNLVNFFKVEANNITTIYNGIKDEFGILKLLPYKENENIKILFIGRIEEVKQQIKVVNGLSHRLNSKIKIDFVGDGSQVEQLKQVIKDKGEYNFSYKGFSTEITKLISEYHYVMLFSQKEGLGLTLVESCMVGRPVITRGNDGCEACAEVCIDQYNGFVTNTIEELEKCLNSLVKVNSQKYDELSVHAREIYNQKFQLQTMLSKYVDYLENIWKERNEK